MIDKELLQLVLEDLLFLKEEWDNEISDSSLRRSSTILRNLITQDLIGKASRSLNYEFKIDTACFSMDLISNALPIKLINLYSGGGAEYGTGRVISIFQINSNLQPEQRDGMMKLLSKEPEKKEVKFSKYKTLPALIIDGKAINKDTIIQYIANKKGGAHLDNIRKDTNKEDSYKFLDSVFNKYQISQKNVVYFELLSIGQDLSKSKSTVELIKLIESVIK